MFCSLNSFFGTREKANKTIQKETERGKTRKEKEHQDQIKLTLRKADSQLRSNQLEKAQKTYRDIQKINPQNKNAKKGLQRIAELKKAVASTAVECGKMISVHDKYSADAKARIAKLKDALETIESLCQQEIEVRFPPKMRSSSEEDARFSVPRQ